jgi:ketosteroid isomerase-like protein
MSEAVRQRMRELYARYAKRDLDGVMAGFADDAVFISFAPVDVFPFLGRKVGKPAIAAAFKAIGEDYELLSYVPTFLVADDTQAAALIAARFRQRASGRIIQVTLANFVRFRDGRITDFREFMDTFDAVEQVTGREIEIKPEPAPALISSRT